MVGLQQEGLKLDVRKKLGISGVLSSGHIFNFQGPSCEVSSRGGETWTWLCIPP